MLSHVSLCLQLRYTQVLQGFSVHLDLHCMLFERPVRRSLVTDWAAYVCGTNVNVTLYVCADKGKDADAALVDERGERLWQHDTHETGKTVGVRRRSAQLPTLSRMGSKLSRR